MISFKKLTGPNTTSPAAGTDYDQVSVTGNVTLTNPTLNGIRTTSYVPAVGASFKIINNTSGNAIAGTFNNLAEGATDTINFPTGGGVFFKTSYLGGAGHDGVLTTLAPTTVYVDAGWTGTPIGSDPSTEPTTGLGPQVFEQHLHLGGRQRPHQFRIRLPIRAAVPVRPDNGGRPDNGVRPDIGGRPHEDAPYYAVLVEHPAIADAAERRFLEIVDRELVRQNVMYAGKRQDRYIGAPRLVRLAPGTWQQYMQRCSTQIHHKNHL